MLLRAYFLGYRVHIDLFTLILTGEEHKLWTPSFCKFLHHPFSFQRY